MLAQLRALTIRTSYPQENAEQRLPGQLKQYRPAKISMSISTLHCGGLTLSTPRAGASCDGRPILGIKVLGITGTGLIDTAAKRRTKNCRRGSTPFAENRIDTGDHPPHAVPPYSLTPAKKSIMESLNLHGLHQHKSYFMSTIDLKSGYWQVGVTSEDQDKTAFMTPFGTFRFKCMPFDLRNALATFQRLIDRLLTSPPILIQPNYYLLFVLRTDASDYALEVALLQEETPHDERPIVYATACLPQRNVTTPPRSVKLLQWYGPWKSSEALLMVFLCMSEATTSH
ncbi:RNA-directed DNA polymerase homolog [Eumeta japonica]|uniref:RNA-directed DNA polymerase homolog n=1 Tax=Eumeta variegata TaxID=151549 RepID=A0A4C1U7B8_EUMVA|nr:RNA-directed DNA polymerase homolog [Eumeta japonica]